MAETPPVVPRGSRRKDSESASSRSSVIEARKSIHLADISEFEVTPDLTNFRPVTLTVSSFFKQVTVATNANSSHYTSVHPTISMHILHTVSNIFPKVLTRRTCLSTKNIFSW